MVAGFRSLLIAVDGHRVDVAGRPVTRHPCLFTGWADFR